MSRFVKQEDGHFLDRKTGLVWKEHPEKGSFTWAQALKIENEDWRLPTFEELRKIVSKKRHNNTGTKLPNMPPYWYWSSPPYVYNSNYAWIMNFYSGYDYAYVKGYYRYAVRLVKRSS
jgi:hypothetical protein